MKKLLIISPYFPPSNAADMQRVRMSLPYFKNLGWHAEVVIVDQAESDMFKDELLSFSIPNEIKIHQVGALPKKYTAKFGLGSLALRSMWFYNKYLNNLLKKEKFDLIYFSTTQFPITILGAFWKKNSVFRMLLICKIHGIPPTIKINLSKKDHQNIGFLIA